MAIAVIDDSHAIDRVAEIAEASARRPGMPLPLLHAIPQELGYIADRAVPMMASALNLSRAGVHCVVPYHQLPRIRGDAGAGGPLERSVRAAEELRCAGLAQPADRNGRDCGMTIEADAPISAEDRLIDMANRIARTFVAMGHDHAAAPTADHIANFRDPRTTARVGALLAGRPGMFSAEAFAAVARLQAGPVASQTRATECNTANQDERSDAG